MEAHSKMWTKDYSLKRRLWRRYSTPWQKIVSHSYEGAGTEEDPYLVTWLENGDEENPLRWSSSYQWAVTWLVAWTTLAASFASSSYSAAIPKVQQEFPGYSSQVYIMGVSAFVLGYAFGPLLWAPMSEVLGRRRLFIVTYALFTIFNAAVCASQNIWTLIILRLLAGSFGASPLTNAAGVVADIFPAEKRGSGMAIFSAAPFTGPTLGPIVGGFLGEAAGWRWVCGVNAILSGVLTILGTLTIPETYSPVLLRERANKLTAANDNPRYIALLRKHREKSPNTPLPPESRLAPAMLGAILLPLGLFWFAWTCQPSVHWIVSILANIPFGMGMVMIFLSLFTYIADVYTVHAASALAANSVLRSLFGVAFPLFTTAMYDGMGINWASTLVAFLALAMTPQPFLFYKYGKKLRLKSTFSRHNAETLLE
ncbi:putative transporter mfs2 [Talaromyces islandicus]|uniref:Putative transporter mfs2 n=1 Tax=Talaromyces islandicus TaxID=28573 RepID=A0A0U1M0Y9_TALIS|nr:putative transporter mfs2 [Talaromyces islandicus]